jgi:hypothetical protein
LRRLAAARVPREARADVRARSHPTIRGARLAVALALVLICWLHAGRAAAQVPVTDRAYAIDLYDGVAIGDTTLIGMGGAGAANARGTAGVLLNPSAIAVRSSTEASSWSIDWHLDVVTATYSSDYDNNGETGSGGASLVTTGLGGRIGNWSVAVTGTVQATELAGSALEADATRVRIVLAKWIPSADLALGAGVQTGRFEIGPSSGSPLFSISGTGLISGATWLPAQQRYRLAAALDTSIDGGAVDAHGCDPMDCNGYILPDHVRAPWRFVTGAAYRIGPTAWNQQVAGPFRDEQALTLAADVVITGPTSDGYGLEAFGQHELQRSGRHTVASLRGGLDYEWKPGKLRVRAGGYWEPGRFDDVGGRFHTTFGADLRVLQFPCFGPRRLRISVTGDLASRYRNLGFSIGFWH